MNFISNKSLDRFPFGFAAGQDYSFRLHLMKQRNQVPKSVETGAEKGALFRYGVAIVVQAGLVVGAPTRPDGLAGVVTKRIKKLEGRGIGIGERLRGGRDDRMRRRSSGNG